MDKPTTTAIEHRGDRSDPITTVAGTDVAAFLQASPEVSPTICVDPPPVSWADLKPRLLDHLVEREASGAKAPRFLHMPLCAFGGDHGLLQIGAADLLPAHPLCLDCRLSTACSPPARWSPELWPFPEMPILERWQYHHARLCQVIGATYRAPLDRLARRHVETRIAGSADTHIAFEVSIRCAQDLVPATRLVIYRGPLPDDPQVAQRFSHGLIQLIGESHDILGQPSPRELTSLLLAHTPFRCPIGFEATAAGVDFKIYVELGDMDSQQRRQLTSDLCRLLDPTPGLPSVEWRRTMMIGLTLRRGALVTLKLYIATDPLTNADSYGLPRLATAHPAVALSRGQALAVLDLGGDPPRPAKWDFSLRHQLLAGPAMVKPISALLERPARHRLHRLLSDPQLRLDLVALGLRGRETTLYLDLT